MSRRINLEYSSYELSNGLKVYVQPDHRSPVISYQTWVGAGSANDPSHRTGMAHLFEHLMFKGTQRMPEGEFDRRIEEMGGRTNAATWLDWTQFYVDTPSRCFETVLGLEFDRIANLTIDPESLETEREVILNERGERVDDDPDGLMAERLWHMAFGDHPYGQPTIGWQEHIESITVQDCHDFYRSWYRPEQIMIVVAGDIEPDIAFRAIDDTYSQLERRQDTVPDLTDPVHPKHHKSDKVAITTGGERVLIGLQAPPGTEADSPTLEVLNEILFAGDSSHMERTLVTESEVAAAVYGFVPTLCKASLYEVGIDCRPGRTANEALAIFDGVLEEVSLNGLTEKDLLKARNRIETRLYRELQTAQSRAQALGYWGVVAGNPGHIFERAERLGQVGLDDLHSSINRYLQQGARVVVQGTPVGGEAQ
mgnify:CR=1 FL=1